MLAVSLQKKQLLQNVALALELKKWQEISPARNLFFLIQTRYGWNRIDRASLTGLQWATTVLETLYNFFLKIHAEVNTRYSFYSIMKKKPSPFPFFIFTFTIQIFPIQFPRSLLSRTHLLLLAVRCQVPGAITQSLINPACGPDLLKIAQVNKLFGPIQTFRAIPSLQNSCLGKIHI